MSGKNPTTVIASTCIPMKGMTPLYIFRVWISLGATPLRKNRENPKGGVKKLVWRLSDIKIPNHKGSAPLAIRMGPTRGTITKIISM